MINWNKRTAVSCAFLAILTFLVFHGVFRNDFVDYDDQDYVTENASVQRGFTEEGIKWAFRTGHAGNWHPVTWLSHMVDYELFGMKPAGHHATSLALHIANSILLFLLLQRLTGSHWRSLCVATLFAIHPTRVESVAWVSERKDVLSTFFALLCLLAYAKWAQLKTPAPAAADSGSQTPPAAQSLSGLTGPQPAWFKHPYFWVLVCFALGLMSKPMLVTLPFVMLLLDFWPLNRWRRPDGRKAWPDLVAEKVPLFILTLVSCIVTYRVQQASGAVMSTETFSAGFRFQNVLVSYARYLGNLFWPVDLAPFYPTPERWPVVTVLLSGVLVAGLSLAALLLARKRAWVFTGWYWFLGMLVPAIGIVQAGAQSMADRYTYLPYVGLFLVVVWGVNELGRLSRAPGFGLSFAGGVALVLGFLSFQQTMVWKDTESLFKHTIAVTAPNHVAQYSVGSALVKKGQIPASIPYFQEAARLQPGYGKALNNLGMAQVMMGQLDEGIANLRRAVDAGLVLPELHFNLGAALASKRQFDEAATEFQNALKLRPGFTEARCELALALARASRFEAAHGEIKKLAEAQPQNPHVHKVRGMVFAREKQFQQAVNELAVASALAPGDADIRLELAKTLVEAGRRSEAGGHLRMLRQANPGLPERLLKEARGCLDQGDAPRAVACAQGVVDLTPDDPNAHHLLGIALIQAGQPREAVWHFRELLRLQPGAQSHYNLALALTLASEVEAVQHYRAAVQQQPDWALAANDLAWVLATYPDPAVRDGKEAVRLAELACTLTERKEPRFIGTLGAAYAEAGKFDEAVKAATQARDLAQAAGQAEVAEKNTELLALFKNGTPYRQGPAKP